MVCKGVGWDKQTGEWWACGRGLPGLRRPTESRDLVPPYVLEFRLQAVMPAKAGTPTRPAYTLLEILLALALTTITISLMGMAIQVNLNVADKSRGAVDEAQLGRNVLDSHRRRSPQRSPLPAASGGRVGLCRLQWQRRGRVRCRIELGRFDNAHLRRSFRRRPKPANRNQPPLADDAGYVVGFGRRHATGDDERHPRSELQSGAAQRQHDAKLGRHPGGTRQSVGRPLSQRHGPPAILYGHAAGPGQSVRGDGRAWRRMSSI